MDRIPDTTLRQPAWTWVAHHNGVDRCRRLALGLCVLLLTIAALAAGQAAEPPRTRVEFPRPLASYSSRPGSSLFEVLKERVQLEPINLVATIVFFLAISHTFIAPKFQRLAHRLQAAHRQRLAEAGASPTPDGGRGEVSFGAELAHFLGEVEAIFGLWVVPLVVLIILFKGWPVARDYLGTGLNFTEPFFVVVIMTMAASRPVLELSERLIGLVAALGRGSVGAWWVAILTLGPVLGSFITEPAAMTICALLLANRFYALKPSPSFAYATLGLLFVNVSVGGTLTHFAAPPVLMVADAWGWGLKEMVSQFGWKAVAGIVGANLIYLFWFRNELKALGSSHPPKPNLPGGNGSDLEPVPVWITAVHILFLVWTVMNSHFPTLFVGGFLFYLAFTQATEQHQSELALRPALLVGFFLAGLVVHGGLQGWWIGPVLGGLKEMPLFLGAAALTAFNDNAAITYLATLVPGFAASLKYAVVAGAVAGGGLTVIANAPNPAGQSILGRFFPEGVSPLRLFLGALVPTVIVMTAFWWLG